MKCPACSGIRVFKRPEQAFDPDVEPVEFAFVYSSLIKGKGSGCQICYAIFRSIEILTDGCREGRPMNEFLRSLGSNCLVAIKWTPGRPLEVRADVVANKPRDTLQPASTHKKRPRFQMRLCFELFTDEKSTSWPSSVPLPWFGPGRIITNKPSTDRRTRLIKQWLKECQETHPRCQQWGSGNSFVPRRVLDLSGNPRSKIRLLDGFDRSMGDYAILTKPSHNAKNDTVFRSSTPTPTSAFHLTWKNHKSFTDSISWVDLPAAFKDTVAVVSEQGIRYLWIDTLCILQDDDSDYCWHIEHLQDIYMNACLNIAPTRIQDVGASFLGPRKLSQPEEKDYNMDRDSTRQNHGFNRAEQEMMSHEIVLTHKKEKFSVYMRRMLCLSHDSFGLGPGCPSAHHPTTSRSCKRSRSRQDLALAPNLLSAWGFVQRMMTKRTVHFHSSEMVFQCRSWKCCECTPSPIRHKPLSNPSEIAYSRVPQIVQGHPIEFIWRMFMGQYPHLQMPDNGRRLHALAGVLPWFEAQLGRESFAGVMAASKTDLASKLLWMVTKSDSDRSESFKSESSFQPSWSWVSMVSKGVDTVEMPQRHVHIDPSFLVNDVSYRSSIDGVDEFPKLSARFWYLMASGRLILGKISPKFRKHTGHSFVPANEPLLDYFIPPPPKPRTPPVQPPVASVPPPASTGLWAQGPLLLDPQVSAETAGTRPMLRSALKSRTQSSGFQPSSEVDRLFMQSEPGLTPRAVFMWDCDKWAAEQSSSAGNSPIYAYFLRIGGIRCANVAHEDETQIDGHVLDEEGNVVPAWDMDVGLVLRKGPMTKAAVARAAAVVKNALLSGGNFAPDVSKYSGPGLCLERIGIFSVPHRRGYFKNAEVQDVTLI